MILLSGSDAYSPFRMDALRDVVSKLSAGAGRVRIEAKWVYAIDVEGAMPDMVELERAASLLGASFSAGPEIHRTSAGDGCFFVFPRKGTISPWSSKATDIFRNCGLKTIKRVERGIRFMVEPRLPVTALSALHDRMTEGVYRDVADIFAEGEPKPGRVYDVLTKGVEAIREAYEHGCTFFDTAEVYGPNLSPLHLGHNERIVSTSGALHNLYAYYGFGAVAACVIY
jgi:phosphoribosylformylglycinamidine synthase